MNPVENKQPSQWAIEKASELMKLTDVHFRFESGLRLEFAIAKELDSVKAELGTLYLAYQDGQVERDRLKSKADGLADVLKPVLDAIKLVQPNVFKEDDWNEDFMENIVLTVKECRAIKSTLEAYRKGK